MSERRLRDYKEPVNSEQHNRHNVGILAPGRYCGFDSMLNVSGLNFDSGHTNTGLTFTELGLVVTNKRGVWMSPMGVLIEEDAAIPLTCNTNAGNLTVRVDTIVGEHEFIAVTGGQAAIYSILQGNFGNINPTPLPNPEKQVALGYITIPAGDANLNNATYQHAYVPNLGGADIILNNPILDQRYAIKANMNLMGKINTGHSASSFGTIASGKWTMPDDGPHYVYPIGGAATSINEITNPGTSPGIPTGNSTIFFIYNGSLAGNLTLILDGTPAVGGIALSSGFLFGYKTSLVLGFGDWAQIMYINGGLIVIDTSIVKKEDAFDHYQWRELNGGEKSALAYTINHNNGTSQVGFVPLVSAAASVNIWSKIVGKTIHVDFGINNIGTIPGGVTLLNFVSLEIAFLPSWMIPKRTLKTIGYMEFHISGYVKQPVSITIDLTGKVIATLFDSSDLDDGPGVNQLSGNFSYELP